jgi:hypothetical protein
MAIRSSFEVADNPVLDCVVDQHTGCMDIGGSRRDLVRALKELHAGACMHSPGQMISCTLFLLSTAFTIEGIQRERDMRLSSPRMTAAVRELNTSELTM